MPPRFGEALQSAEIAELWGVSVNTIIRAFQDEPDVLKFGSRETRFGRKRITLRIPESVMIRVHGRLIHARNSHRR